MVPDAEDVAGEDISRSYRLIEKCEYCKSEEDECRSRTASLLMLQIPESVKRVEGEA